MEPDFSMTDLAMDSDLVHVTEGSESENQQNENLRDSTEKEISEEEIFESFIDVAATEEYQESDEFVNKESDRADGLEALEGERNSSNGSPEQNRQARLPLSRIKHIIKMDPDVSLASQEAVYTIAMAAEYFIGTLTRDASNKTAQARRRIVLMKDLEHILDTRDCYAFLEGMMDS